MNKCPTCESPDPARHPAVQFEGEVQLCRDPWHKPSASELEAGLSSSVQPLLDGDLATQRAIHDGCKEKDESIPEYFAKAGVTEALSKHHPVKLVRQMALEILRLRAPVSATTAITESELALAKEVLEAWANLAPVKPWPHTDEHAAFVLAQAIVRLSSTEKRERPVIVGIDQGRPGGDFTGYACSCGQVRVEPDGPCERKGCPIRSIDGRGHKEQQ